MSMPFASGLLIDGYRIEAEIGRGGMAVVYRAVQESLRRDVAIKVLPASLVGSEELRARFRQEALAVARLRHPAILVIHAVGEYHEMPYLVMEYVDGGTLAALLGVPRPLDQVIRLLRPIAEALDYAHGQGILHRDVKPANILLRDDGSPVLADFGLARVAEGAAHLTRTGLTMGTPAYMAPEQAMQADAALTPAVDRYALAVIAYEMLTGQAPFRGPTPLAVAMAQVQQAPPSPRALRADIPTGVEAVLLKGLAKEPRQRYPRAVDFIDALARGAAIGAPSAAMPATVRVGAETAQAALAAPTAPDGPATTAVSETAMQALAHSPAHGTLTDGASSTKRRLGPLATALALLLAVLAGGVGYVLAHHPPPPSPKPRGSATPNGGVAQVGSATPRATFTPTALPSATAAAPIVVPTVTLAPSDTPPPTQTPRPTHTPAPPATYTPQPTYTPFPTNTTVPTSTPFPSDTPVPSDTPLPTTLPPPPTDLSGDACAAAGSATNAVARFYEAVDERRFDAAYQCFDAGLLPIYGSLDYWESAYTTTVATRLMIADDGGAGTVDVTLYSLDQTGDTCKLQYYQGYWNLNDDNTLHHAKIKVTGQQFVDCGYTVPETAAVEGDNQQIVSSQLTDVTGDDQPDHLLLTNGPNGVQVWVYSKNRLVFAAPAPGAQAIQVIGNDAFVVSGNGLNETWEWANYGFERVS